MKKFLFLLSLLLTFTLLGSSAHSDESFARLDSKQYPLIMFAVPYGEENFALIKSMGIDYVHVYAMSKGPLDDARLESIQKYLDLAQKHDLKVMFDMDGHRRVRQQDKELALQETRTLAKKFKDHPALGFWYLYDEPELSRGSSPEVLKRFYDALKEEAPAIPVCVCTSTSSQKPGLDYKWSSFLDTYDLHVFDVYPVKGQVFPDADLTKVTKFNAQALALGKPVVPALQTWNYITIDKYVKQAEDAGQSTANWRYPNLQELRFWNFAALIQGARGMSYWSYARAAVVPKSNPAWVTETLKPSTLEFRDFVDTVHPARERQVIETGNENLFMARWDVKGKIFFAVANGSGTAQKLTDTAALSALNKQALKPWKFTRAGALTPTTIELTPWEVLVWETS